MKLLQAYWMFSLQLMNEVARHVEDKITWDMLIVKSIDQRNYSRINVLRVENSFRLRGFDYIRLRSNRWNIT